MLPNAPTTPNFIKLNDLQLIEIDFQYERIAEDNEKRFVGITNRIQQLNLMLVDSKFPEILADVAQIINSLGNCTLQQIMGLLMARSSFSKDYAERYYQYKFKHFLLLVLYSNVATNNVCKGVIDSSIVYYYKTEDGDLEYLSIYNQRALFDLVLSNCICNTKFIATEGRIQTLRFSINMPEEW